LLSIVRLYDSSIRKKINVSSVAGKKEDLLCECATGMHFSYRTWIMQSIEVKLMEVKQFCSMYLCTKFWSSTLSHLGEIRIESCQNSSALPADKLYSNRKKYLNTFIILIKDYNKNIFTDFFLIQWEYLFKNLSILIYLDKNKNLFNIDETHKHFIKFFLIFCVILWYSF